MEIQTEISDNSTEFKPKHESPKKTRCPVCGSLIWKNNILRHSKTKKHTDAIYIMCDRFEIK